MKTISLVTGLMVLGLGISGSASASGIVTVSGKLTSMTEKLYVVETRNEIYKIVRAEVPKQDQERIERTDIQVNLYVPFSGVQSVQYKSALNTRGLKPNVKRR